MNTLHLLSQNHLTGAEVYAVTLGTEQQRLGHQVHQISNGFFYPSPLIQKALPVETRSKLRFWLNVLQMRRYFREHQIDLVHAHSRAAAKLGYWATLGTPIGYVSTVHGQQHASLSKRWLNKYGQFMIAVCENIQTHLIEDFHYGAGKIKVIRNPIDPARFYFSRKSEPPQGTGRAIKIGIIGRTTGPKKERTEQVVRALLDLSARAELNCEITLVGGRKEDLGFQSVDLAQIHEIETPHLSTAHYEKYDIVVGSGRVCMEALISGAPTIAFGESQYVGLIRNAHFNLALHSNFGDIDSRRRSGPRLDLQKFEADLQSVLKQEMTLAERKSLSEKATEQFSITLIQPKIQRLYQSAVFLKKYPHAIPVLMYHKVPNQELQSRHKIFVTKENFEKHLRYFQDQGFQTLTFSQLQKFRTRETDFKFFPTKPLMLTFDDGYRDNLESASPLLQKYGFNAQIFLLADSRIASNQWDASANEPSHEIISGPERQLWKTSAFEIGSHGFSHRRITEMSNEEALSELVQSKKALETEFQTPVNVFAFTYGDTNPNMASLAANAGYDYAVNTDSGGFLIEESPHEIFRVNIFPHETPYTLYKKTSRWYRRYYYWKRKR